MDRGARRRGVVALHARFDATVRGIYRRRLLHRSGRCEPDAIAVHLPGVQTRARRSVVWIGKILVSLAHDLWLAGTSFHHRALRVTHAFAQRCVGILVHGGGGL